MESEKFRYWVVFAICTLLSFGWIVYEAIVDKTEGGGRGGAIAVAVSFATMFLSRGYDNDPLSVMTSIIAAISNRNRLTESLEQRISVLEDDINTIVDGINSSKFILDRGLKYQNIFLAVGSVVGTIAWGFGDCASSWLRAFLLIYLPGPYLHALH